MSVVTLSPKFQVVIPKDLREALRLKPGEKLEVHSSKGHIEMSRVKHPRDLVGSLKGRNTFEREKDRSF